MEERSGRMGSTARTLGHGAPGPSRLWLTCALALSGLLYPTTSPATILPATDWQKTSITASRLIIGSQPTGQAGPKLFVGLEIKLKAGWKTYWRHPGDAGGRGPHFDWSASRNLKSAKIHFPAPKRLSDPSGQLIGYKKHVVFPMELTAIDPARPIDFALAAQFGVCRQICVFEKLRYTARIAANRSYLPPRALYQAIHRIPRQEKKLRDSDPRLLKVTTRFDANTPHLQFEVASSKEAAKSVDLFVETNAGSHLPMAKRVRESIWNRLFSWISTDTETSRHGHVTRFRITIPRDIKPATLMGKTLRITLTTPTGASEFQRQLR